MKPQPRLASVASVTSACMRPPRSCSALRVRGSSSSAALTYWSVKLPVLRGSMWSLKDTLVQAGAIVERRALRPLRPRARSCRGCSTGSRGGRSRRSSPRATCARRRAAFSRSSACCRSAACRSGVVRAVGVVSVMGGFSQDLKRKILGNNAHIVDRHGERRRRGTATRTSSTRVRARPRRGRAPRRSSRARSWSRARRTWPASSCTAIDPATIGNVIDLPQEHRGAASSSYLENPEKLRPPPARRGDRDRPGRRAVPAGAEICGSRTTTSIRP